jgi:hypothetical protein
MDEDLIQARDCALFAARDLRSALARANAVEALVLLPLIAQAAQLAQAVDALIVARADQSQ